MEFVDTFWALVPAVVAIILALITKEAYSSLFIGILVGGHIFNFAINALGAYVHSCRLQYIEFFGKFFEGGGRAFKPLMRSTKYVDFTK